MNQINESFNQVTPNTPSLEPKAEILEEHVWKHGGPKFKNVQPKSYKILEQQLPQSEQNRMFLFKI